MILADPQAVKYSRQLIPTIKRGVLFIASLLGQYAFSLSCLQIRGKSIPQMIAERASYYRALLLSRNFSGKWEFQAHHRISKNHHYRQE